MALRSSVAAAIGYEARAGFTHFNRPSLTCQSPVLNVARDPRVRPSVFFISRIF